MNKRLLSASVCLIVANCNTTTTPTQFAPMPAGYADGTKTLNTAGLIFTAISKTGVTDSAGDTIVTDATITYQTTSDPSQIVAVVNGESVTMNFEGSSGQFVGNNSNYSVSSFVFANSADNQASLLAFQYDDISAGSWNFGYAVSGLTTNPADIAALSGSATYNGASELFIIHGNVNLGQMADGSGTVLLNADFGTGTISGSMTISDKGSSTPGFALLPTTITIDPTMITGNGFSTTISATASDLAMTSITSSSLVGNFLGVNGANVGGSFSGSGISADGTTPATFYGGFLGE